MKKRGIELKINLSNKAIYTLIVVGILVIVGVGVWAYGTSSPSDFGHSLGEFEACDEGETLQVVDGEWDCVSGVSGELNFKTVEIGAWDMNDINLASVVVFSGEDKENKIRTIYAVLQGDNGAITPLDEVSYDDKTHGGISGIIYINYDTKIMLRHDQEWFTGSNWDGSSNRGWVTIGYVD
jgi:hypothetical protein